MRKPMQSGIPEGTDGLEGFPAKSAKMKSTLGRTGVCMEFLGPEKMPSIAATKATTKRENAQPVHFCSALKLGAFGGVFPFRFSW